MSCVDERFTSKRCSTSVENVARSKSLHFLVFGVLIKCVTLDNIRAQPLHTTRKQTHLQYYPNTVHQIKVLGTPASTNVERCRHVISSAVGTPPKTKSSSIEHLATILLPVAHSKHDTLMSFCSAVDVSVAASSWARSIAVGLILLKK